ncbi:hypothetical protein ACTWPT_27855 [Nonomuraea sp. 3N208]|uniref:hypothetical protein n=1 Tax=Nonomuraea sp. 3N208 TaxID=3457421 RepID=UPI003FD49411
MITDSTGDSLAPHTSERWAHPRDRQNFGRRDARHRAGVGSVPVLGGSYHEMNNVRANGKGSPVFCRCFSCHFFSTDFTHLPQLRDLRRAKTEHSHHGLAGCLRRSARALDYVAAQEPTRCGVRG